MGELRAGVPVQTEQWAVEAVDGRNVHAALPLQSVGEWIIVAHHAGPWHSVLWVQVNMAGDGKASVREVAAGLTWLSALVRAGQLVEEGYSGKA